MNEHIKKLLDRALDQAVPETWTQLSHEQMTRLSSVFAELIVLKCADIINHRADTCSDWLDSVKANEAVREGQRECAKTIKEHFGVEE
jgi:hypothetical protein